MYLRILQATSYSVLACGSAIASKYLVIRVQEDQYWQLGSI